MTTVKHQSQKYRMINSVSNLLADPHTLSSTHPVTFYRPNNSATYRLSIMTKSVSEKQS